MQACIERGMVTEGILPAAGGAAARHAVGGETAWEGSVDPLAPLDWVTVYAMAVNEENAAAAGGDCADEWSGGVVPAVARYYRDSFRARMRKASFGTSSRRRRSAFCTRRTRRSAGGSWMPGRVGVACSMAAAGWPRRWADERRGGARGGDRHGAQPGHDVRSDRRAGADSVHRAQRDGCGEAVQACRLAMNETEGHKVSLIR